MSESVHSTQDRFPFHLSSANQYPFVYLPCPCPCPFPYPYPVHRLSLSNHQIRVSLALVVVVHNHVRVDSFRNLAHQIDRDSRKGFQGLRGKAAGEGVAAQVDDMEVVGVGVMAVAKVLVQVVDSG